MRADFLAVIGRNEPIGPNVHRFGAVQILTRGEPAVIQDAGRITIVVSVDPYAAENIASHIHRAAAANQLAETLRQEPRPFAGLTATAAELVVFRDAWCGPPLFTTGGAASSSHRWLVETLATRTPNPDAIARYLAGRPPQEGQTLLDEVARVMPGTLAMLPTAGRGPREEFGGAARSAEPHLASGNQTRTGGSGDRGDGWRLTTWFAWNVHPIAEPTDEAHAARFRRLLADATDRAIGRNGRVGVSLSGGMDSTAVATMAREQRPSQQFTALCVPFSYPEADERALQEQVATHLSMPVRWAPLDDAGPFLEGPDAFFERFVEPPLAPNMFFVDRIAAAARDAGVEVVLDGIDGDGAVGGNWWFLADLARSARFVALRDELRAISATRGIPVKTAFKTYVVGGVRHGKRFGPEEDAARSFEALAPVLDGIHELYASYGLTVTHPFMDPVLRAEAFGLPREQKVRRAQTKVVLRNAMQSALPEAVTQRVGKARMGAAFGEGLEAAAATVNEGLAAAEARGIPAEGLTNPAIRFRTALLGHWLLRRTTN